jgi:hypothetical protein
MKELRTLLYVVTEPVHFLFWSWDRKWIASKLQYKTEHTIGWVDVPTVKEL